MAVVWHTSIVHLALAVAVICVAPVWQLDGAATQAATYRYVYGCHTVGTV